MVEVKKNAVEEQLGILESYVNNHVATQEGLKALENQMNTRFDAVDARFDAVDARFDKLESKIDALIAKNGG